ERDSRSGADEQHAPPDRTKLPGEPGSLGIAGSRPGLRVCGVALHVTQWLVVVHGHRLLAITVDVDGRWVPSAPSPWALARRPRSRSRPKWPRSGTAAPLRGPATQVRPGAL